MSDFSEVADLLDDMSVIFEARRAEGGVVTPTQAGAVADGLTHAAKMIRLCDAQRVALVQLVGRPVAADGVTLVLMPGGRA